MAIVAHATLACAPSYLKIQRMGILSIAYLILLAFYNLFTPEDSMPKGSTEHIINGLTHLLVIYNEAALSDQNLKDCCSLLLESDQRLQHAVDDIAECTRKKEIVLSSVSHELRNPLNMINGTIVLALKKIGSGDMQTLFKSSQVCVNMLLNMINNMLDRAQIEARKASFDQKSTDFHKFINKLWPIMSGMVMMKSTLLCELFIQKGMPRYIIFDQDRLLQICLNLLSNSVKYSETGYIRLIFSLNDRESRENSVGFMSVNRFPTSPDHQQRFNPYDGTSQTVDLTPVDMSRKQLVYETRRPRTKSDIESEMTTFRKRHSLLYSTKDRRHTLIQDDSEMLKEIYSDNWAEGRHHQLNIRCVDTGCGFSAPLSFTPFENLRESHCNRGGLGLSLFVTKSLVELMKGTLGYTSRQTIGSTFNVAIPIEVSTMTCLVDQTATQLYRTRRRRTVRKGNVIFVMAFEQGSLVKFLAQYLASNLHIHTTPSGFFASITEILDEIRASQSFFSEISLIIDDGTITLQDIQRFLHPYQYALLPKVSIHWFREYTAEPAIPTSKELTEGLKVGTLMVNQAVLRDERALHEYMQTKIADEDQTGAARPTLLVADDDSFNQMIMRKHLEENGFRVLLADNGEDAWTVYYSNKDDISAILLDYEMPRGDGPFVAKRIQSYLRENGKPDMPIICVTANVSEKCKERALLHGMKFFFTKPVNFVELGLLLQRIAVGSPQEDPAAFGSSRNF